MTLRSCNREEAVRLAAASGRWTPALEAHAAICTSCGEVKTVTEALAAPLLLPAQAVNPVIVWARATQAAQLATAARMSRILTVTQILAASIVLVVLVGGAALVALTGSHDQPTGSPSGVAELAMAAAVLLTGATLWVSRWATRP